VSVDLYGYAPPNSVAFVIAHLLPLAQTTSPEDSVAARRWSTGMALPYRAVTRVAGTDDQISDFPVIRVHTFARDYTSAAREADRTHRRMLVLADDPLYDVTMPGGITANCASLTVLSGPREEDYAAESVVVRFVAEYLPVLRFIPVS
jgi:hypothetical protein